MIRAICPEINIFVLTNQISDDIMMLVNAVTETVTHPERFRESGTVEARCE